MYIEQDDKLVKADILLFSNLQKLYEPKHKELNDNKEREKFMKN